MTDDPIRAAKAAEEKRKAAMLAGDTAAMEALFADGLLYAHSDSSIDTRASYIDKIAGGQLAYHQLDCTVEQEAASGDTVILGGVMTAKVTLDDAQKDLHSSYMVVWTGQGGDMRLLAHKSTPLPRG